MAEVKRPRRYYLLKRVGESQAESGLANVWRAKQEAEAGVALPADFPLLAVLSAVGYETVEDLDGADADELDETCNLTARQSATVLAALTPLL